MRFLDPTDPQQGMEFDGRIAEDFKLGTGTWVSVGPLRARLNAAFSPYVQDTVIAGHDRGEVGALIFPSEAGRTLGAGKLKRALQEVLDRLARESGGSSERVVRALVLAEPPSIDSGEITDKGSINQRAVLARRAGLVESLYTEPPAAEVLVARRA
jgi:feruloyl-CoA synthase